MRSKPLGPICRSAIAVLWCLALASAPLAEELEIVGTGDGAKILAAVGAAFSAANPGVTVGVPPSIGSSGGIKAVGTDARPVGRVARPIKDKEKPYGLTYRPYAKVPVVFFVNESLPLEGLTAQQVLDIYSGKVSEWGSLKAGEGKIRVVRREDGDSSLASLQGSFPGFKDLAITEKSKTAQSTPEAFAAVEETKGTIGFGPYDVALDAKVKILKIDGKTPTDPGYPSFTTLALVFKEANRTGALERFLDFLGNPEARAAITRAGGVAD